MKGGKELNDPALVKVLVENSAEAVDWVNEIGGDLSVVGQFGGASVKRIHRPGDTSAVGPMLVKALNAKLEELGIPVLLETTAKKILVDETGKVTGVEVEYPDGKTVEIAATAVVIATGGFGANADMVVSYNPGLEGFASTNHSGATGDGIRMALEVGAGLTDIEQIQTHPTVNPDTTIMYTEGVRGNGAILVNKEGKRFVDELSTRDVVSAAILSQTEGKSWLVFDQDVRDSLAAIEKYVSQGIIIEAASPGELGEVLGIDGEALEATIAAYKGFQEGGADEEFGRKDMSLPLQTGPYYAGLCVPAVHHTMGGIKINPQSEVLTEEGSVIPGLFAAGEVTGGVHGGNRLGGNAVTDVVVFGRIAGEGARAYVEKNGGYTEREMEAFAASSSTEGIEAVDAEYNDGTYTATGKGNNGDMMLEVVISGGKVTAIKITEHKETPGIYEKAESDVIAAILARQSADVDVVAGATNTSKGIKEAVDSILKENLKK